MTVKRTKVESRVERRVATGMIVSEAFMDEIHKVYSHDFIDTPFVAIVCGWCLDYYAEFGKTPGKSIQDIYEKNAPFLLSEEIPEIISQFLDSLADEYVEGGFDHEFAISETIQYFKRKKLQHLAEDITIHLENGDVDRAEELTSAFYTVNCIDDDDVDPFADRTAVIESFTKTQPIFYYPGALGELINEDLCRESFVAFMAPEKRGKTWWLLDMAMRALSQRCSVAFFQAGDMTRRQQLRRIYSYVHKKPIEREDRGINIRSIFLPVLDCIYNQLNTCMMQERVCSTGCGDISELSPYEILNQTDPNYTPCTMCVRNNPKHFAGAVYHKKQEVETLSSGSIAFDSLEQLSRRYAPNKFRLATYPNKTLTVKMIEGKLTEWERKYKFAPDVVIVDYADILQPESKYEFRHQQNEIWQRLRALSQKRMCLVITATQSAATSYDHTDIKLRDFSEDKRKYSHTTTMCALNQTPEEKLRGILRVGILLMRESDFDIYRQVVVLQCLSIGRPYLASYFLKKSE